MQATAILEELRQMLAEVTGRESLEIKPESRFAELGIDSVSAVDALTVLKAGVGQPVTLQCPPCDVAR